MLFCTNRLRLIRLSLLLLFVRLLYYCQVSAHLIVTINLSLLEQLRSRHPCVSDLTPGQSAPPWAGAGLLHARSRVLIPLPHVLLQGDQGPQVDHFPSLGSVEVQKRMLRQTIL